MECAVTEDRPGDDPKLDTSRPNTARIWDYQLGGKDNFEADRQATDALTRIRG